MKKLIACVLLVTLSLLSLSCGGGLSEDQQAKLDEAFGALERLSAATDVGVNNAQYGALVIEAQASVTEATRVLPEGGLSTALARTVEAHADAKSVWDWSLTHVAIRTGRGPGTKVIEEYGVPSEPRTDTDGNQYLIADQDEALQLIWAEADKRYATALEAAES